MTADQKVEIQWAVDMLVAAELKLQVALWDRDQARNRLAVQLEHAAADTKPLTAPSAPKETPS